MGMGQNEVQELPELVTAGYDVGDEALHVPGSIGVFEWHPSFLSEPRDDGITEVHVVVDVVPGGGMRGVVRLQSREAVESVILLLQRAADNVFGRDGDIN